MHMFAWYALSVENLTGIQEVVKEKKTILCVTQKAQNICTSPDPTVARDINIHTADSQDEPHDETSNIIENRIT